MPLRTQVRQGQIPSCIASCQYNSFADSTPSIAVDTQLELSPRPLAIHFGPKLIFHRPHSNATEIGISGHTTLWMVPYQCWLGNCCCRQTPPLANTVTIQHDNPSQTPLNISSKIWFVLSDCPSLWGWYVVLKSRRVQRGLWKLFQNSELGIPIENDRHEM